MSPGPVGGADPDRVAAAAAAWIWVPDTATRVETDEYLVVRFSDYYEHPLQLVRLHPRRPLDAVLDEVLDGCRQSGLDRVCCWVRLDAPAGLEDALLERGGVLDETLDVLARPVSGTHLPALAPPSTEDGVEVRWVRDLATFRQVVEVGVEVFGGRQPTDDELLRDLPGETTKLDRGGGGTALALLDGVAVGSGGVTVADGVGRMWGGAVRPGVRGRGIYRALLDARLRYAVQHGCDLALVKGRVQTSAPILRRGGFEAFGQERSYLVALDPL